MNQNQKDYIELLRTFSTLKDLKSFPKENKDRYNQAMLKLERAMTASEIIEAIYKAFSVPHKSIHKDLPFTQSDLG